MHRKYESWPNFTQLGYHTLSHKTIKGHVNVKRLPLIPNWGKANKPFTTIKHFLRHGKMPKFQKIRQDPPHLAKIRGMVHCYSCDHST